MADAPCATATKAEEQAEFTFIDGPVKSRRYETRVAM